MLATWRILDRGDVPKKGARKVPFTCIHCGRDSTLEILGIPEAQIEMGIVFDVGEWAMPKKIQCRHCRRVYISEN